MSELLDSIRPTTEDIVYDLVAAAGVDVNSWAKRADGGAVKNPAVNSDKSFRWSFLQPHKVAVLIIWYINLDEDEQGIYYPINPSSTMATAALEGKPMRRRRAEEMGEILQKVFSENLPIRAIIIEDSSSKGKKRRLLDVAPWRIDSFNAETGQYVLRRVGTAFAYKPSAHSEPYMLVLAENEAHAGAFSWQDVTGERYQFPKNYRNVIRPGTSFVYYKGTRGADGERIAAAYFGAGVIGDVYPDPTTTELPKSQWKWLADIEDYKPFDRDIPIRDSAGMYLELGTQDPPARNYWGVGVRRISRARFQGIVSAGGHGNSNAFPESPALLGQLVQAPGHLLQLLAPPSGEQSNARKSSSVKQYSKRSKFIGDAAEELFYLYLCAQETDINRREQIKWVARDGVTPGYDIEDGRQPDCVVGYEVKGTTGPTFPSFLMTENELRASRSMGKRYVIVLVSNCLGTKPLFEKIVDPAALMEKAEWAAVPSVFRIERRKTSQIIR